MLSCQTKWNSDLIFGDKICCINVHDYLVQFTLKDLFSNLKMCVYMHRYTPWNYLVLCKHIHRSVIKPYQQNKTAFSLRTKINFWILWYNRIQLLPLLDCYIYGVVWNFNTVYEKNCHLCISPTDSLFRPVIVNTLTQHSFITKVCNTFVLSWNEVFRIYNL